MLGLILLLFFSIDTKADPIKVMTFNTMCDFCEKEGDAPFSERSQYIREIIQQHRPDLVSLQEVRKVSQINKLLPSEHSYQIISNTDDFVSYADPSLLVNTAKFTVLKTGQFWLGPRKGLSLGWKIALPRQVHWAVLKSIETSQNFLFIGSHFDNRVENMIGSAKKIGEFIEKWNLPVIFAADTNSTPDFTGYKILREKLSDSFLKSKAQFEDKKHYCYYRKGKHFPACRVDHILLSKNHSWRIHSWQIDTQKFGNPARYPSDHRAVISEVELIPQHFAVQ